MNEGSLISVIIPTKDRSTELARAIKSVLSQTYQSFEILVVDDKSSEDVKLVTEKFEDNRIKYFLNTKIESNANVCRNIGLQNAKGEFVAMLDSDDAWLPHHLESKLTFLLENEYDGVFGSAYVDDGEKRILRLSRPRGEKELMLDYLLTTGKEPTPTHFYKTVCARQILWDETLLRHQDFDFSARFAERFSFEASESATCIIHWEKGENRLEHTPSQIRFYELHIDHISAPIRVKYCTEIYSKLLSRDNVPQS